MGVVFIEYFFLVLKKKVYRMLEISKKEVEQMIVPESSNA